MVVLLAGARVAAARPMLHFDLAGLIKESDEIVYADRVKVEKPSTYSRLVHYRVTRVVRGKLAVGAEVAVEEFLYTSDRVTLDPQAVLFLATRDGKYDLVSSGLRVVHAGKVYRFEQYDNPGGWTMVPQGDDPTDIWNGTKTPLDLPGFERALAAAQHRVDALAAALALTDRDRRRAAVIALFAPPGGGTMGGFFHDELAQEAEQALVSAGDLDGALLVHERDRTAFRYAIAPRAEVVAIARDTARPTNVRVQALAALDDDMERVGDADIMRVVIALLDDREPAVRAAAAETATPHRAMSSDPKQDAQFRAIERDERAALAKRWAVEADPAVLYALAEALEHPPARTSLPAIVGRAYIYGRTMTIRVRCTHPHARMTAPHAIPGVGEYALEYTCDDKIDRQNVGTGTTPAGSYPLVFEATIDGKPAKAPLGTLTVGADGAVAIVR